MFLTPAAIVVLEKMNDFHCCIAQFSFVSILSSCLQGTIDNWSSPHMASLLKSTILSVGLLAGVAATAHAQSVSALPPDSGASGQTARSPVFGSTQSFYPRPGGGQVISQDRVQPQAAGNSDKAQRPYSTNGTGPKAN
jgi:hypothetical protein